jgi:dTMP kinase
MRETYGKRLPGMQLSDLAGKLIVIEGTDGAGRTTQINLLKPWLEELGHAVLDTGMTRSPLAGEGIRRAKEGNNLGRVTQSRFYATDFVDRLENEIVPALRAGFVVLTDRYIYSLMARAVVRGVDPAWIRSIFSVALKPDAVFYLRLSLDQLIPRVIFSRGFDYWESGMDLYPAHDMYEAFCNYQHALLAEFERLSTEYHFDIVDAAPDSQVVFASLQARILEVLEGDSRKSYIARQFAETYAPVYEPPAPKADPTPPPPVPRPRRDLEILLQSLSALASFKDAAARASAEPALEGNGRHLHASGHHNGNGHSHSGNGHNGHHPDAA